MLIGSSGFKLHRLLPCRLHIRCRTFTLSYRRAAHYRYTKHEEVFTLALAFLLIVFLFVVVLIALFAFPPAALVKLLQGDQKKK